MNLDLSRTPVYVIGVGLHPYQNPTTTPYVELGLMAIRAALADAGVAWQQVETAVVGSALVAVASGRPMLRHLGSNGLSITHVENASATGSTAVRTAIAEIVAGGAEIAMVVGVDKPTSRPDGITASGRPGLGHDVIAPVTDFALFAEEYMGRYGVDRDALAAVAVKNHRNGALNSNAQRREVVDLADVLASPPIAGVLTKQQCCPVGEGAAAVVLASESGLRRLSIDRSRAVRIAVSVSRSEQPYVAGEIPDKELTRTTSEIALRAAGIEPADLDVLEVHDAFSVEELAYIEAVGLADPGEAGQGVLSGRFDIGGECAVSPSGGLISMGHPIGPTGVGQIAEITAQLRGEAGARQQPAARIGLAHMLGVGAVCVEHVLIKD